MKRWQKLVIGTTCSILIAITFMIRTGQGYSTGKENLSFLGRAEYALYDVPRIAIMVAISPTVIGPIALYGEELNVGVISRENLTYRYERFIGEGYLWGFGQSFAFWWPFIFFRKKQKGDSTKIVRRRMKKKSAHDTID